MFAAAVDIDRTSLNLMLSPRGWETKKAFQRSRGKTNGNK
jgi:hypothetical protein